MLHGDQPGSCGTTEFDEGDCSHGFSGAWDAAKLRLRTLDDCAHHCVARCARCRWVSFSAKNRDCSWFFECAKGGPTVNGGSSEFVSGDAFESYRSRRVRAFQAGDVDKNVRESEWLHPGGPSRVTAERSGERPRRTLIALVYHESRERTDTRHVRQNLHFFLREGVAPALSTRRFHFALVLSLPRLTISTPPGMTVHQLNGSSGFELWHYREFLSTVWCERATARRLARRDSSRGSSRCPPGTSMVMDPAADFGSFVLIPDTVRGPFLPNFVPAATWPDLLTGMLSEDVKLVGPSINCNDCHKDFSRCREGVHTDGHLIAVDSVGMRILMKHWRRPSSKEQDCEYNEVGQSVAVLAANYSLAALQTFWRGHDFRDPALTQAKCKLLHAHALPQTWGKWMGSSSCEGCQWGETDLAPLEVMFVHRTISPNFRNGATAGYSEMKDALERLARNTSIWS